jgi:cell division protein FtsA
MASPSFITGLDVGTKKIKVLVARPVSKSNQLELVTLVETSVRGMTRRGISDREQFLLSLQTAIQQAEQESSLKIKEVYLNLGSGRFQAIPTHSLISVSRADREISPEDVDRVLQAAKIVNLSPNYEIWGVVPKEFIVDEQRGIQKPLGMKGTRLEVEALLLTIFSPYREKLEEAVTKAGLNIQDMFLSSLASAEAVLTPQEKEKGVAVVDIGAGLTKVTVFKEGALLWAATFSLGSDNITDDLAVGLRIDGEEAERMKKELKTSLEKKSGKRSRRTSQEKKVFKFSKPRIEEILEEINKHLLKACRRQDLPAGVVLTGGGAKLKDLEDLAKKEFKLPVRVGVCSIISGLEKDPSLSTVAGLVLMANQEKESRRHWPSFWKRFFRIFLP